ncbi:MAG: DUF1365 family protein [Cellvibrionaceae bacterium]
MRHRRFGAKPNAFIYRVFMVYLDLQEIDKVMTLSRFWSASHFNLAWFRRSDYFDGDSQKPLYNAVADLVQQRTGICVEGPIRMLTNLRYFGYIINPITCYYCFDKSGQNLQTVVAEVTNTPWGERTHYVLPLTEGNGVSDKQRFLFAKGMHVSPFQSMGMEYRWRGKTPSRSLFIHIDVDRDEQTVLDATVVLKRKAMNPSTMNQILMRYPLMTVQVLVGIYWQALKLFVKGARYYPNSKKTNP